MSFRRIRFTPTLLREPAIVIGQKLGKKMTMNWKKHSDMSNIRNVRIRPSIGEKSSLFWYQKPSKDSPRDPTTESVGCPSPPSLPVCPRRHESLGGWEGLKIILEHTIQKRILWLLILFLEKYGRQFYALSIFIILIQYPSPTLTKLLDCSTSMSGCHCFPVMQQEFNASASNFQSCAHE